MPTTEFDQKVLDLDERLRRVSATWRTFVQATDKSSRWTLLNKVLFVLDGDPAEPVHAYYDKANGTGKIAVFADSYLLYGEGLMTAMSIKVIPRAHLEGLEVLTAADQTSDYSTDKATSYVLSFKHGIQVTLPLGPGTSGTGEDGIHSLVRHYKEQLTGQKQLTDAAS